jgi:hypothetical protein
LTARSVTDTPNLYQPPAQSLSFALTRRAGFTATPWDFARLLFCLPRDPTQQEISMAKRRLQRRLRDAVVAA